MRTIIASFKLLVFGFWCLFIIPTQLLSLVLLGNSPLFYVVPKMYHRVTCLIFGLKINLSGQMADGHVLFAGNHLSYIDISTIGSVLSATFISKDDVKNWPLFGLLASISKTIFISRDRNAAVKCIADIKSSLDSGRSLILFPEGTSTNGAEVLPFKSSLFELFLNADLKEKLIIQPFTVSIQRVDGRDVKTIEDHDYYAWYGDMTLPPHLWALAQTKGVEILIEFHEPLKASDYDNRKVFALDCHKAVANGLTQNIQASKDSS